MNQERQPKSIVFHSPLHASLPVAGTDLTQGPNPGPAGREGSPAAGSRAQSLPHGQADVASGSSGPSDAAWELKRIEGRPDSESRGRISEMPEDSGTASERFQEAHATTIAAKPSLGLNKRDPPLPSRHRTASVAQVQADATARRKGLSKPIGKKPKPPLDKPEPIEGLG